MIYHIVNWYRGTSGDVERMWRARGTWKGDSEYRLVLMEMLQRNAQIVFGPLALELSKVGDLDSKIDPNVPAVPFVKDLFDAGSVLCDGEDSIIMVTNADSNLCMDWQEFVGGIQEAGWSYRTDTTRPERGMISAANLSGKKMHARFRTFHGADLFCVRAGFWRSIRSTIPDMVMGYEGWDSVLRGVFGESAKIGPIVYHEQHGVPRWRHNQTGQICGLWNRWCFWRWMVANSWCEDTDRILEYEEDDRRGLYDRFKGDSNWRQGRNEVITSGESE